MKVAVCGAGRIGLTTGVALAYVGHEVSIVDRDQERIRRLSAKDLPVHEPWLKDLTQLARKNLRFLTSCKEAVFGADVVFLALDSAGFAAVEEAVTTVCGEMNAKPAAIVNRTDLPIGAAMHLAEAMRQAVPSNRKSHLSLVCNPDFLREGAAVHDALYPDRIVVGTDEPASTRLMHDVYQPILEQSFTPPKFLPRPGSLKSVPLVQMNLASAELMRHAANVFLALKVSFVNEIALLAEQTGADASQVARTMGMDPRIGSLYMTPGVGWGGPWLGKDVNVLISAGERHGLKMPISRAIRQVNTQQREHVVDRLRREMGILEGRRIALLGLAFKPDADDLTDAPAVDIARKLVEAGAQPRAHDPLAIARFKEQHGDLAVQCCATAEEAADGADALVLLTEWPEYLYLPWDAIAKSMANPLVLDGRCFLPRERLERVGFRYVSLGRPDTARAVVELPASNATELEAAG